MRGGWVHDDEPPSHSWLLARAYKKKRKERKRSRRRSKNTELHRNTHSRSRRNLNLVVASRHPWAPSRPCPAPRDKRQRLPNAAYQWWLPPPVWPIGQNRPARYLNDISEICLFFSLNFPSLPHLAPTRKQQLIRDSPTQSSTIVTHFHHVPGQDCQHLRVQPSRSGSWPVVQVKKRQRTSKAELYFIWSLFSFLKKSTTK